MSRRIRPALPARDRVRESTDALRAAAFAADADAEEDRRPAPQPERAA